MNGPQDLLVCTMLGLIARYRCNQAITRFDLQVIECHGEFSPTSGILSFGYE